MRTTVKFAKVNPKAIIPSKRDEDAGMDIYACFEDDYIVIAPHETKLIPTGIASACDTGYCFVLKERGSTGIKGMGQRCGIIDSGYRDSWFVPLTNHNDEYLVILKKNESETVDEYESKKLNIVAEIYKDAVANDEEFLKYIKNLTTFYPYEKAICQALLVPVPEVDIEEYTYDELTGINSVRGMGALGSSGK